MRGSPSGYSQYENPGEVWRYQGMTVASKQAAMVQLPHDQEVKLPLYMLKKLKQMAYMFDPRADFRFVGGCVRDMLLDRKPKDFDVVTNTTAETLQQMGLENVGKAFPVYLYQDPTYGQIEIAVARSEEKMGWVTKILMLLQPATSKTTWFAGT